MATYTEQNFEDHIEAQLLASGYHQHTVFIFAVVTGKIDVRNNDDIQRT